MTKTKQWLAERLIIIRPLIIGAILIIIGTIAYLTWYFVQNPVKDYQIINVTVPRKEKVNVLKIYSKDEAIKQVRLIAEQRNFKYTDYLIRLIDCESKFDQFAINKVSSATGWFQIIDAHKLTRKQRYDLDFATNWTMNKIEAGGQAIWECDKIAKK